jgi:ATP-dependent DNA helicase RecG
MTLHDIINLPENYNCEFKEAKNRQDISEATKYLCAISNHGGGRLVLGVTDKRPRRIVGSQACPQPESTVRYFMDKIRVRVDFKLYESEEGKRVLVFEVASRPIGLPVQFEGIAWWRDGDSLAPMPEDVRRAIYAEGGHDFTSDVCPDVTIGDLHPAALNKFRKKWRDHTRNKRISSLSDEQLLRDCGAITNKGVTYAAMILFGKREALQRHLPHTEVIFEYRSKENAGPAAKREEFTDGFFTFDDRIWELINLRNEEQHYRDKLYRHPIMTFNEDVVREAVLNAVSHRNYQMGGSIFVRQYQNRLVVESPGGFPHGITVDNILNRQNARNRLIANIFKLCGLVERSGQGMNLIYETAIKEAKPLPDFNGSDKYFVMMTQGGKVINNNMLSFISKVPDERLEAMTTNDYISLASLFVKNGNAQIDRAELEHLAELGIVRFTDSGIELINGDTTLPIDCQSTATVDWQSIGTSDRQRQILEYMAVNNITTTTQLAKVIGLTQGRIRTLLQELVIKGYIEKDGDYRYATYKLTKRAGKLPLSAALTIQGTRYATTTKPGAY